MGAVPVMEPEAGVRNGRRQRAMLALIIALAAALRLYHLGRFSLWYDEGASLYLTRFVDWKLSLFHAANNTEAPLHACLVWAWNGVVKAVSPFPLISAGNDALIRLLPAMSNILCVPMIYVVARRYAREERAALLAAFLFAISPLEIYYAQELRVYSEYVLIGLCALYCLDRAIHTRAHGWWLALFALMALLLYSHFIAVWIIFIFNLYVLFLLYRHPHLFWRWTFYMLGFLAVCAPGLWLGWKMNGMILKIELPWYPAPTVKTAIITYKNLFAGYSPRAKVYWPLLGMAMLLCAWGLYQMRRNTEGALLFALLIFVPIPANVFLWSHRHFSFYEHRLFIFSGAAALAPIALGMWTLPRPVLRWGAVLLFTGLTLPCLGDYYAGHIHPLETHRLGVFAKVDFRSAARYIQEHWEDGDFLAHYSVFSTYSMFHYLPVPQAHLAGSEVDAPIYVKAMGNEALLRRHGLLPVDAAEATKDARRVWLIEPFGITFDQEEQSVPIHDWLAAHFREMDRREFDGVRVILYTRAGKGQ